MPKTANELIRDAITRHTVYLQRIAGTIRNGMMNELDKTQDALVGLVLRQKDLISSGVVNKTWAKQIEALQRQIAKVRQPGYQAAESYATDQFEKIINNEIEFTENAIRNGIGVDIPLNPVPPTAIANVLALGNYTGMDLKQWYGKWAEGDLTRVVSTVRNGLAQGNTLDETVRALVGTKAQNYTDGIINSTRNGAQTLTRTITNGITNAARNDIYARNADIISAVQYSAVLDGRTSLICVSLDGQQWLSTKEATTPPTHANCRSALIPVIDGFGVVGNRPSVGGTNFNTAAKEEYINKRLKKGDDKKTASGKWNNLTNSTKNKMRNEQIAKWDKNVIGPQPSKTTYAEWLKNQPKEFQADVLGKTRADIFARGGVDKAGNPVTLSTFVDNNSNKPYTLAQLKTREPQLFKADKK